MASWKGSRKGATSSDVSDDRTQPTVELSCSVSTDKSPTATDLQKQSYMMGAVHQYPSYRGSFPPFMTMRPGVKSSGVNPVPYHFGHMPMMPPNYSAMMMSPFVCIHNLFISYLCSS